MQNLHTTSLSVTLPGLPPRASLPSPHFPLANQRGRSKKRGPREERRWSSQFFLPPSGSISIATQRWGSTHDPWGVNHQEGAAMQGLADSSNSGGSRCFLLALGSQLWAYTQAPASRNNSRCPNNLSCLPEQTRTSDIHGGHWPVLSSVLVYEYLQSNCTIPRRHPISLVGLSGTYDSLEAKTAWKMSWTTARSQSEWPTLSGHSAYFGLGFLTGAREGFQTVFPGLCAKQLYFYLSGFHVRLGL